MTVRSEIEFHLVDINGISLHYAAKGQGQTIIFLHGFPACWYAWKPQLEQFGNNFRAIAPDCRGVNLSSKPRGLNSYALDVLVTDIIGLADALSLDQFILVGHDWGGALAWEVARNYPERVSHLVVLNAPPIASFLFALATLPEQRNASAYINRLKAAGAETALLADDCKSLWQISFSSFEARGIYDQNDRTYYLNAWQKPGAITAALNWYRVNIPAFEKIIAKEYQPNDENIIYTPSMLLWGEHEKAFTRQLLAQIPRYVPNLEVVEISDTDHWINIERPELLYKLIYQFTK